MTSESGSKVDLAFKGDYILYTRSRGISDEWCGMVLTSGLGSAVYVYGQTGPECGGAEVMLDGQVVASLNMTVSYTALWQKGSEDGKLD